MTAPGVELIAAIPGADVIQVALLIGALLSFALAGKCRASGSGARVVAAFGVAGVTLAAGLVTYFVSNYDQLRTVYNYPATFASLEDRYDVTLDDDVTSTLRFPPPRGKTATVNQKELGPVTHANGTVIENVYVQWSTWPSPRVALVVPADGTNTLLVTRATWWPELPVKAERSP